MQAYLQEQLNHATEVCLNHRQQYHGKLSSLMHGYLEAPAQSTAIIFITAQNESTEDITKNYYMPGMLSP